MAIAGKFAYLYLDDKNTPVMDLGAWSLSLDRELINTTHLDLKGWQTYVGESSSYVIHAIGYLTFTGTGGHQYIFNSYLNMEEVNFRLHFGGGVPIVIDGKSIIEDMEIVSSVNDIVTINFTLRGVGEIFVRE